MEDSQSKRESIEKQPLKTTEKAVYETGAQRNASTNRGRYDLISGKFLRRLAIHLEKGAINYGSRNWEKGIPLRRSFEALVRHIYQWLEGEVDEDHLAAVACNIMFIIHTEVMIETGKLGKDLLADLPDSYFEGRGYVAQEAIDTIKVGDEILDRGMPTGEFLSQMLLDPSVEVKAGERLQVDSRISTAEAVAKAANFVAKYGTSDPDEISRMLSTTIEGKNPQMSDPVSDIQDMVLTHIQISEATQMYGRGLTDLDDAPQYPESQHYMAGYNYKVNSRFGVKDFLKQLDSKSDSKQVDSKSTNAYQHGITDKVFDIPPQHPNNKHYMAGYNS